MKHLFTLFALFIGLAVVAQEKPETRTKTIIAKYVGNIDGDYTFVNTSTNAELKFTTIPDAILNKYTLEDTTIDGSYFSVDYSIEFLENNSKTSNQKLEKSKNPYHKIFTLLNLQLLEGFTEK